MWSTDVVQIGDNIAKLTLTQAVQLSEYLETVHGVKPVGFDASSPLPPQEQQREVVPEKTEYSVFYEGFDTPKKLGVIKEIRVIMTLGIKEAKEFVEDTTNRPIREGLSKLDAETLKQKLELAGAKISIR